MTWKMTTQEAEATIKLLEKQGAQLTAASVHWMTCRITARKEVRALRESRS